MPGDSSLPLLDAALRGALIALLALLGTAFWRERVRWPAATVGGLLALCLIDYAFTSAPAFPAAVPLALQVPMMAIANGNAVLFWLFARALLEDDIRWRGLPLAAWCLLATLGGLACGLPPGTPRAALGPVIGVVLAATPFVFGGLVIVATLRTWGGDLVEPRRRLRAVIVAGGTLYLLASAIARVLATPDGRFPAASGLVDILALTALVALIAWRLLRLGPSALLRADARPVVGPSGGARWESGRTGAAAAPAASDEAAPSAHAECVEPASTAAASASAAVAPARAAAVEPADPATSADDPDEPTASDPAQDLLADRLALVMNDQRAYRDEDLSITRLAARLSVPEYRLRRLINQRLGHRNFSSYVNQFRLAEAMAELADPKRADLPVLTIALQSGFQSIGPFNRAFKAHTGLTPTEFRRKHQADSGNG